MMDYEALKLLAKEMKRPVKSLLAESPQVDPFYCGMPAQVEKAQWFADLWNTFGYTKGVHLRRMHYQIISQDPPVKMVKGKDISLAIVERLEADEPGISDADIPEAEEADERDGALFDSARSYLEQNDVYQAHKGNGGDEDD